MVEGHQCHRVAAAHRRLLVGRSFKATSPNARFEAGAAAINGRPLTKIEVHGKNIFYFFSRLSTSGSPAEGAAKVSARGATSAAGVSGDGAAAAAAAAASSAVAAHEIVHVHFGMSGRFKTMKRPGDEATPTTRLRLESDELDLVAHLSAMTVNHGDDAYYACAVTSACHSCPGMPCLAVQRKTSRRCSHM
jgi:Formamidopyrimidine-DNA glycosylase N-terminal domain